MNALFEKTIAALKQDTFDQLQKKSVILFGVGGVGSWCAEALIRTGITKITLVDCDTVSYSNCNRQLCATTRTVGSYKCDVLKKRFQEINPEAQISVKNSAYTFETAAEFPLSSYDYILDAIDTVPCKTALIENAVAAPGKLYSSMGAALRSDSSRIQVSTMEKTHTCSLARIIRKQLRAKNLPLDFPVVFSDEPPQKSYTGEKGSLIHITAIFGFLLAGEIIQDIQKGAL
ncbi:MAG: tRNA threonylcarbamoyladenosine dehydratase [Fibrobacterota bacterium]